MKFKTIALAIALLVILGGGAALYNSMKDRATLPDPFASASPIKPEAAGFGAPAKDAGSPAGNAAGSSDSAGAPTDGIGGPANASGSPADSSGAPGDSAGNSADDAGSVPANQVKAPDFTAQDANGNGIKFSDMTGVPIVLNFWASWCPPCKSEMPEFENVYKELGESVRFMMVNATGSRGETVKSAAAYIENEGFTFPVYYDIKQSAVTEYGIRAFPTSVFIDAQGYIVAGVEGAINEATLRKGIELIMKDNEQSDNADQSAKAEYRKITAEEAKRIMDGSAPYILLDVRTDEEYWDRHIEGAMLIPDSEITSRVETELPDKNALILVYCRSGRRSAGAAYEMVRLGYTNVYDFGGINDWPYETVKGK